MSISCAELNPDCGLARAQSEGRDESEVVLFGTQSYHTTGIKRRGNLAVFPREANDIKLLQPLTEGASKIGNPPFPFSELAFHVYFIDTNYPILYKKVNTTLHFFLPGSGVNYDNRQSGYNPVAFSRMSSNYFGNLLSHDKPLNEIFRHFQFNGVDCNCIKSIGMNGASLGGGMQQFLLVYILQNMHMFKNLSDIALDIEAPCCFHSKIIASLNQQFNDALSKVRNRLNIDMSYSIHLKDPVSRRGNPFTLQCANGNKMCNVTYRVELYAHCEEIFCYHKMQGMRSSKYECDIIPDGKSYEKYHKGAIGKRTPYQQFRTSDFTKIQNLIDIFFPHNDCMMGTFDQFFLNTYGHDYLRSDNIHFFILNHEDLADAMIEKYKSKCILSERKKSEVIRLSKVIEYLDNLENVCILRYLAKKRIITSEKQGKWNSQYLKLCSTKSELVKLIVA